MYKYPLLAFLSSILDLVTSLALSLPDATIHATQIEPQRSPAPTIAPYAPLDLIKRAEAYTYGFFDGDANNPDSCDIGYSLFATNNYYTCCSTDSLGFSNADCTIASTCLDFSATNLCDSQQCGPGTLLCSNPVRPSCIAETWRAAQSNFSSVGCGTIKTTYNIFQFRTAADATTSASPTSSVPFPPWIGENPSDFASTYSTKSPNFASSSTPSLTATLPSTTTETEPTATTTSTPPSTSTSAALATASAPPGVRPATMQHHTAAIAGGTIGGVAGLLLVVVGAIWLWCDHSNRRQHRAVQDARRRAGPPSGSIRARTATPESYARSSRPVTRVFRL